MSDLEEDFDDQAEEEQDSEVDAGLIEADDLDDDDLDDLDDDENDELRVVEEVLSQKEQNARALAIRRALEERLEQKRLHDDLDYLDD